ncbi:hypothetical protein ACRAWD_32010 [Caulobacter segnis]
MLKGPQGTLYGRNATGGAVNVISAKPKIGDNSGQASAEYGNYDTIKASGAVNLALGQDTALRIAGQIAKHDGYFSDGYDDEDTKAVRAQLKYDPAGGFDATISIDYADVGGMGSGGVIMPLVDGDARLGPSDPKVVAAYTARNPTAPVPQLIAKRTATRTTSSSASNRRSTPTWALPNSPSFRPTARPTSISAAMPPDS